MLLAISAAAQARTVSLVHESCSLKGLEDLTVSRGLLVAHGYNGSVTLFDLDLERIKTFYRFHRFGNNDRPMLLADTTAVNDTIYATDYRGHNVIVLDRSLNLLREFGAKGTGEGSLRSPIGIAYFQDALYVAEHDNNRVSVFDLQGKFRFSFGSPGRVDSKKPGEFHGPYDIETFNGRLYVSDRENNRIQIFNAAGRFLKEFGGTILNWPHNISFNERGELFVADSRNNAIKVFNADGKLKYAIQSEMTFFPKGIAVHKDHIYITSLKNERERTLCLRKLRLSKGTH